MGRTGIIYSKNTNKTKAIAQKIVTNLEIDQNDEIEVEECTKSHFESYDNLILGVPTWFDGEIPFYWDEFLPELEEITLHNKKIAIFGLGDQKEYPENFCDGIGIVADFFRAIGAQVSGEVSSASYEFESSRGYRNGKFQGLPLDQENQGRLTEERVELWCEQLKEEFAR